MKKARVEKWVAAVPTEPVVEVAVRSLENRLDTVRYYIPLAADRAEEDTEYVHRLRVSTRRATSAVQLYASLLPRRRAARLVKSLKRLRRAANEARDCDVLVDRAAKSDPAVRADEFWRNEMRRERARAQKRIVVVNEREFGRGRFARRTKYLVGRIRMREDGADARTVIFGDWSRVRLLPVVERFFAAADSAKSNARDLHTVRVLGKELRYGMELLGGAFPDEFRSRLYPAVEELLNRLGEVNDSAMAAAFYREKLKAAESPEQGAVWRRLMSGERSRFERCRREFQKEYPAGAIRSLGDEFKVLLGTCGRIHESKESQT